jgi:hypothetical protein
MIQIVTAATLGSPYMMCLPLHKQAHGEGVSAYTYPETTWGEGTKIKPRAIMDALKTHPLAMWVDADCSVDLPAAPPDGAWDVCLTENAHPEHNNRISAAFILFRRGLGAEMFLKRWDKNNVNFGKDHNALTLTIKQMRHRVRFGDMTEWLKGRHTINAYMPERGVVHG